MEDYNVIIIVGFQYYHHLFEVENVQRIRFLACEKSITKGLL